MLLTRTVTKKILEQIVHESFTKFGRVSSSSLLDSLKLLGFHYATNAGISKKEKWFAIITYCLLKSIFLLYCIL